MKKRNLMLFVCVLFMAMLMPTITTLSLQDTVLAESVSFWDGSVDITWFDSEQSEFVITTPQQLAGLSELVTGGNDFSGKSLELGANIFF